MILKLMGYWVLLSTKINEVTVSWWVFWQYFNTYFKGYFNSVLASILNGTLTVFSQVFWLYFELADSSLPLIVFPRKKEDLENQLELGHV